MTETSKLSHDAKGAPPSHDASSTPGTTNTMFVGLTISMAWQLAVVVIVGLFGGHELDVHFKTAPLWTLVGLGLAMVAMVLIVRRTLQQLNEYMNKQAKEQKK